MKFINLLLFFGILTNAALCENNKTNVPRLSLSVELTDKSVKSSGISPEFVLTVSSKQENVRVLKSIYRAHQNLEAIQATLISPTGDTAFLVFPKLSADSLVKTKTRSLTLQISPDSPLKIPFDLNQYWSQFQKTTDVYMGPYPGAYKIRFEFGWSEQNWENLIASGILRVAETLLTKESVFSEWTAFDIKPKIFASPTPEGAPIKTVKHYSKDFVQYIEKKEGLITREWLIDPATNYQLLAFTYNYPVDTPTKWVSSVVLPQTQVLQFEHFKLFSPSIPVSGAFTFYSNRNKSQSNLQHFSGQIVSGIVHGNVLFKYPMKQQNQTVIKGVFEQGNVVGEWTKTERNDSAQTTHLLAKLHFLEGFLEGPYQEFFPVRYGNGLRRETSYIQGNMEGANKLYYPNGQVQSIQHFLPETYEIKSNLVKINKISQVDFMITTVSQTKNGEFLGYFEDGSFRHRVRYKDDMPVDTCEFHFRYYEREFHTEGVFKDGNKYNGTFMHMTLVPPPHPALHCGPQQRKYWILHYKNGNLTQKELIIDTAIDPAAQKSRWKRGRKRKK